MFKFIIVVTLLASGVPTDGKPNTLNNSDLENDRKLSELNGEEVKQPDFTKELVLHREKSFGETLGAQTRNLNRYKRWTSQQIPYEISPLYTAAETAVIAGAMREYNTKTCIKFFRNNGQVDYLYITPDDGQGGTVAPYCYSHVGKMGGKQIVKMFGECVRLPAMIHELGHALGFEHEHNRADRDNYITIQWGNIDPVYHYAYKKVNSWEYDTMGLPYDYSSIMHYPDYSFAKTSLKAFTLNVPGELPYENQRLSGLDVQKINKFFNCV